MKRAFGIFHFAMAVRLLLILATGGQIAVSIQWALVITYVLFSALLALFPRQLWFFDGSQES